MVTYRYRRSVCPLKKAAFLLILGTGSYVPLSLAKDYYFDPELLKGASYGQDLARFNQTQPAAEPGKHVLDVFVNGQLVATGQTIMFHAEESGEISACLSPDLMQKTAIRVQSRKERKYPDCLLLSETGQAVTEALDMTTLRLDLRVPQQALVHMPRGYIPVSEWVSGVPVMYLRHNTNFTRTDDTRNDFSYNYLWSAVNAGTNLGLWQVRHQGNLRYYESDVAGSEYKYNLVRSWIERPLPGIDSVLAIGESYTSNSLFGSLSFNGIKLATDTRMWPQSRRGFAPEVRGVAATSAHVVIRQLGQIIYETDVPPGAFVIRDLYNTRDQGDLSVTVNEATGRVSSFTVPYTSVPDSMRPGNWQYELAAGKVRDFSSVDNQFVEGVIQRGISNTLTLNSGVRVADDYFAGLIGTVVSTRVGAFGLNATWSRAEIIDQSETGWRSELSYSRNFNTGTSIVLAAWRYSTDGFRDLQDVLGQRRQYQNSVEYWSDSLNQKNRFSASVNQSMNSWGMLNFTASTSDYYHDSSRVTQLQLGYSNSWKSIGYNLNVARQRTVMDRGRFFNSVKDADFDTTGEQRVTETLFSFGVSIPFDFGKTKAIASLDMTRTGDSRSGILNIAGTTGDDNPLSWSGYTGLENYQNSHTATTAGGSLQQNTSLGSLRASASTGEGYRQYGVGTSGTLLLHQGGVTAGPYASDTFALINAPGARGAKIRNGQGAQINRFGYAILPSLTPYQYNTITLDSSQMDEDTELLGGSEKVVPYAGAVAKVTFATLRGQAVLITTHLPKGEYPPMGADVVDVSGDSKGMVGQGGQIYARIDEQSGILVVKWGESMNEQCEVHYVLPSRSGERFIHLNQPCVPRGDR
ncbi:fimbrial assembly protein [Enterobacter cloacae]|nr:fimbrial assembly protein [Enterobacter cloacae]